MLNPLPSPISPNVQVRFLSPDEKEQWLPLWNGYLAFYGTTVPDHITTHTWQRFHDPAEPIFAVGAYRDNQLIGFTNYVLHRSSWAEHHYCYLEDLFVAPAARGKGAGKMLMRYVQERAQEAQASRLYWVTKEDNHAAQKLYEQLAERTDFIQYRMKV